MLSFISLLIQSFDNVLFVSLIAKFGEMDLCQRQFTYQMPNATIFMVNIIHFNTYSFSCNSLEYIKHQYFVLYSKEENIAKLSLII